MTRSTEELQTSFEKLLGRSPSDFEMARLVKIRDALGIRENDALWLVMLALESYDVEFRRYPALLAAEMERSLERVRGEVGALAKTEMQRAQSTLADAVAKTAVKVADDKVRVSFWLTMSWALVACAVFAGLCLTAGYVLGAGKAPFWLGEHVVVSSPTQLFVRLVLGAPSGWVALIGLGVLIPVTWFRRLDAKPPLWQVVSVVGLIVTALLILISLFA